MKFDRAKRKSSVLPAELIGKWSLGTRQFEIRTNGDFFVLDHGIAYSLIESGTVFVHSGTRYTRLYGPPTGVVGVWQLEDDPTDEWNIRSDGTYTYHGIGFETYGEYTNNATTMSTGEFRSALFELGGNLTFDPPYAASELGPWSLTEPVLKIDLPSGQLLFNRVK